VQNFLPGILNKKGLGLRARTGTGTGGSSQNLRTSSPRTGKNLPTTPTLVQTLPAKLFNFLGLHLHRIGFIGWGPSFQALLDSS